MGYGMPNETPIGAGDGRRKRQMGHRTEAIQAGVDRGEGVKAGNVQVRNNAE